MDEVNLTLVFTIAEKALFDLGVARDPVAFALESDLSTDRHALNRRIGVNKGTWARLHDRLCVTI